MGHHKSSTWYTVYEAYRDRLVIISFARECAAYFGCTVNTFQSMVSKVKSGKNKSYCVVVENLETGFYDVYGANNTGEGRGKSKVIDDYAAGRLYTAGLSDASIAKQLGVNRQTVWAWRKKYNLPSNAKRGRPRRGVV